MHQRDSEHDGSVHPECSQVSQGCSVNYRFHQRDPELTVMVPVSDSICNLLKDCAKQHANHSPLNRAA